MKLLKVLVYAAVLGFNLRQLTRHIAGEVRPKSDELTSQSANEAQIDIKLADSSRLR